MPEVAETQTPESHVPETSTFSHLKLRTALIAETALVVLSLGCISTSEFPKINPEAVPYPGTLLCGGIGALFILAGLTIYVYNQNLSSNDQGKEE